RMQELESRLSRAEREVRMLRAAAFGALVAGVLFAAARPAATQGQATIVKAPFRVVDAAGKAIVEVDADPGEGRRLRLLGSKGELLAHIGESGSGGAEIAAYGETGMASTGLVTSHDDARLYMIGKTGRRADVMFAATAAKGGSLAIADQAGKALFKKP